MTFESVDYGDEDEAQQPIKPARCRCYMPTTATPPPVITAADQVRRNLRLSAKWARFGRLMVEQLLSEHDAAVERAEKAEAEVTELQNEAADPFNPQHIAEAVKRARRQRDEAVETIAAERDEYVQELAQLREQLQSATVLPERWRELMAERDAAKAEVAAVLASLAVADRTIRGQREELNRLSGAGIVPTVQVETRDAAGWTAAENAEFEELYGVRAAMYLRAANDRVWEVVKELRNAAVADGRNPYEDPMAQRLAGALIGEQKAADGG